MGVLGDRYIFINTKRKASEKVVVAEARWWFLVKVSFTSKYGEKGSRKSGHSRGQVMVLGDGFIHIQIGRERFQKRRF